MLARHKFRTSKGHLTLVYPLWQWGGSTIVRRTMENYVLIEKVNERTKKKREYLTGVVDWVFQRASLELRKSCIRPGRTAGLSHLHRWYWSKLIAPRPSKFLSHRKGNFSTTCVSTSSGTAGEVRNSHFGVPPDIAAGLLAIHVPNP